MPSVQFPYLSLETKPLKLTIDKKNCFISLGSYFQVMPKHVVKCGFTSHSAVQLKGGDSIGLGMVRDGTKCGRNKVGYHCLLFNTLPGFLLSWRLLINIQTQSQTLRTSLFHKYKAVWPTPVILRVCPATSHIRKHFSLQLIHRKKSMEERQPLGHKSSS